MTPSNPSNSQPLIYRIMDALGVTHLVACINHTHSQSEVEGLQTALAGKQNTLTFDSAPTANSTNPVTSGGVKAAIDNKLDNKTIDSVPANHANNLISSKAVYDALQDKSDWGALERYGSHANVEIRYDEDFKAYISLTVEEENADLTEENLPNLRRALSDPDSTPTENSTNLVTSGGVYEAIEKATDVIISDNPLDMSTFEKKRVYTAILTNTTGDVIEAGEYLDVSNLPSAERNIIFNSSMIDVPDGEVFGIRFIRTNQGVYAFFDGVLSY